MDFPHLDVLDLPSDINGVLGNTRTHLLRIYNSNRDNPRKLQKLNETLLVVQASIKKGFEIQAARAAAEAEAKKLEEAQAQKVKDAEAEANKPKQEEKTDSTSTDKPERAAQRTKKDTK